jgi:sugar phosphate isomerase/epimerase
MSLPLAGSTFSYLHHHELAEALADLRDHGFTSCELTVAPPHVDVSRWEPQQRRRLQRLFDGNDVRCLSVNPSYADLNLVSIFPEFRELTLRFLERTIELANDLGAQFVVVIPGRLHRLSPAPPATTWKYLLEGLGRLLEAAREFDVSIVLENSPYGFHGTAEELLRVVEVIDHPRLGLCYDVANAPPDENVAAAVRRIASRLRLAHVSDTSAARWNHTSPGRGEVDFHAFAGALRASGFRGVTVYELVDGEDPMPRLRADIGRLQIDGWSVA